jgi:hypothetical protein
LHGITDSFQPVRLLLYVSTVAQETVQAQGQKVIHACNAVADVRPDDLLWAVQTDNASKAAGVAGALSKTSLRCTCHLLALGPRLNVAAPQHLPRPPGSPVCAPSRRPRVRRSFPDFFAVSEARPAVFTASRRHPAASDVRLRCASSA